MTEPARTTVDYEPRPPSNRTLVRDDMAYLLPMLVFMLFTWAGGHWKDFYPATYVAKTVVVAALLVVLWRQFTPVRWNHWWLGVIVGVVGIFQWVGMQLWLQNVWPNVVANFTFIDEGIRNGIANHFKPGPDVFDPTKVFGSPAALYAWYAVRIAGAVLVVPVMEELFWRDFLWRTVISPNDFKLAQVGEWDWKAFVIVPLIFAVVHGNWWLTAIGWGFMIGALLAYTKSLGACIIAHATTNLLLGAWVLYSRQWSPW